MINPTNLLLQKVNAAQMRPATPQNTPAASPAPETKTAGKSNLLAAYLNNQAVVNIPAVKPTGAQGGYKNNLKSLFMENKAKIFAIIPRTFNAKDIDGNEYINGSEQSGTFLNAIGRLDEVKDYGFNTLHILPIHPPGKQKAMGTAGSLYAPADFLQIDPVLTDKNDPRSPDEQFKAFIDECHKRGIKVMLDLPSCAAFDLFVSRPELMAMEADGLAKTPQGWNDIRMFQPWKDKGKKMLNLALLEMHKKYVDWCVNLGVDGIRADVARAKPTGFWNVLIPYSHKLDPEFGWLAETYTYEDASPQANMPYDRPMDSWRSGFDVIYGQYHIFHEWATASEFTNYVKEQLKLSYLQPKGKSLIGSFATHDDVSPMFHGKTDYCNLTSGLQATLPMLNPYFVDGFQSGDYYTYKYENKYNPVTTTDNHEMTVHPGKMDIFNLSRKPGGKNPEIGGFMKKCLELKDNYADLINKGTFIPLNKKVDEDDQIIAYARHLNGKTLLVVANKNVNRPVSGVIRVPSLKTDQELNNLLPSYGQESRFQVFDDELRVDLGPARIHVFEIDTPQIESYPKRLYKQNL